jgi:hypothetical protein
MKSIVLLFWLATASGGEQLLAVTHHDDVAACETSAQRLAVEHAGQASRHKCHAIVPEVGEVDENGNPIEPESRLVSPAGRQAIAGAFSAK